MSSSTKRGVAPVAPVVGLKIPPSSSSSKLPNNGSGPPPPLSYQSEPRDDVNMNEVIEENIELEVILPNGKSVTNVVDHSIPMLDLLIQLAVKNKVNPSNYTLVAISEVTGRPIDYKANQTIGTIETQTIRLVPKKAEVERLTGKTKGKSQPFEMTHRFTVNLPRNQKMVSRISPATLLDQLFQKVCQEKNLNPLHYMFQHPANPGVKLELNQMTVADLKTNEINFVNCAMIDNACSMPDLSRTESARLPQDHMPTYMPGVSEPKKKRGFLSFLKKDKKFKLSDTDYKIDSPMNTSSTSKSVRKPLTPPSERHNTDTTQGVRPKSMFVTSKPNDLENGHVNSVKENTLPKAPPRTGKKRQAPLPPTQTPTTSSQSVQIVVKDKHSESQQKIQKPTDVNKSGQDSVNQRLHSRNSSDSSGYHELTLSGAESPDAGRIKSGFKTSIDTTSIESVDNNNYTDITHSHNSSLANKMAAGDSQTLPLNRVVAKPPRQRSHSLERKDKDGNLSAAPAKPSAKKKRAPAPPQPAASVTPLPTHKEAPHVTETTSQPIESEENIASVEEEEDMSTSMQDEVDRIMGQFDQDISSEDLYDHDDEMMTERASLCSEDIDNILIVQPKSQRPCSFVAPPPPLEPPPDMSPSVEKLYVDKGVVVNDDNASLAAESLKGSPISTHSRISSQSSISSVNTIEDVSLDFEQTIALGEEFLQAGDQAPQYNDEMSRFVHRMTQLTVGSDQDSINQSDSATVSIQDTEESDTGSVVHHDTENVNSNQRGDTDTDSLTESEMSTQSDLERRERERQARISAIFTDKYDSWEETPISPRLGNDSKSIGHSINQKLLSPEADNTLTFDLPPPLEFQNEPVVKELEYDQPSANYRQNNSSFNSNIPEPEDEEEEWSETIEEVYHLGPSSSYTFGGAYKKIPDFESKKEPESPKSKSSGALSSFTYYKEPEPTPVAENSPREKEEFVLTTNDLANVNFIASPPLKNRNLIVNQRPSDSTHGKQDTDYHNNVKSRVSELSFSPNSEGEVDDVLEQKSISLINLPATRQQTSSPVNNIYTSSTTLNMITPRELTPSGWVQKTEYPQVKSSSLDEYYLPSEDDLVPRYQLKPATYSRLLTPSGWQSVPSSSSDSVSESPSVSPSISDSVDESKVAQYELLEQQLKQWQEQLEINQDILASQQFSPDNRGIQTKMQTQIEMQKEMMEQLQKSMSALTQDVPSSKRTPTPPPSPPLQLKFQLKKVSATNRPPVKRFEPKLDPREELMIAIRSFGGRTGLESVSVDKTNW